MRAPPPSDPSAAAAAITPDVSVCEAGAATVANPERAREWFERLLSAAFVFAPDAEGVSETRFGNFKIESR